MSTNYDSRLQGLKLRRQGQGLMAKSSTFSSDSLHRADSIYKPPVEEAYEKRSAHKATRYTLGAMQEVDPDYTKNSFLQGDRIKNQLEKGLQGEIPITFEYQGSVPLNVHLRGTSDVDLLILRSGFVTVDVSGLKNQRGGYSDWHGEQPHQLLSRLRSRSASILRSAFPEAEIDISGSKSIAIEGGSLSRKVDVVPSHWYDTADFQHSGQKKDRGVCILDTSMNHTLKNYPFLHMHHVNEKEKNTNGGTKKIIRLLKTLKVDSDYAKQITLNSYDVAALVWNFSTAALYVQPWSELTLLATAQSELTTLVADKKRALRLRTPDGTRCVIDSEDKYLALVLLCSEVSQLAEAVAQEVMGLYEKMASDNVLKVLKSSVIA